jgi:hypothetical protein
MIGPCAVPKVGGGECSYFCPYWLRRECWMQCLADEGRCVYVLLPVVFSVGNFSLAMGARNHVGIGLLFRPASLCSLATQFQTRFLASIPHHIAGLKFSTRCRCREVYITTIGSVLRSEEAESLDEIQTKNLKSFPPSYSQPPLQLCLRFLLCNLFRISF